MRDATDFGDQCFKSRSNIQTDVVPTGSYFTLGIKFRVRAERDLQVMSITAGLETMPFRDV